MNLTHFYGGRIYKFLRPSRSAGMILRSMLGAARRSTGPKTTFKIICKRVREVNLETTFKTTLTTTFETILNK